MNSFTLYTNLCNLHKYTQVYIEGSDIANIENNMMIFNH